MGRPHSQALNDRAKRLATVHSLRTVAEITGVSRAALWAMKSRQWVAPRTTRPFRPIPSDFAIQSRHMTYAEMVKHYRAGTQTIHRWKLELARISTPCVGRRG